MDCSAEQEEREVEGAAAGSSVCRMCHNP